jgi:hypothetical protein
LNLPALLCQEIRMMSPDRSSAMKLAVLSVNRLF